MPKKKPPRTQKRLGHVQRYVGHCNMQTDIKEATFFGGFIVSGSDDGRVYIWDKRTGELVNVLKASDGNVINCCQPHPYKPLLATSGIEHVIQLWSPSAEEQCEEPLRSLDMMGNIKENQVSLARGPMQLDALFASFARAMMSRGRDMDTASNASSS